MPPIRNITPITLDNLHEHVSEYIHGNKIIIQNYDDMKDTYLRMLRDRYLFLIDRDILIPCLIDLTYMFCPGDDFNKDAVLELLDLQEEECDEDEMDEDDDDGDDGEGGDDNHIFIKRSNITEEDDHNEIEKNTIRSLVSLTSSSLMDDKPMDMDCKDGM
tara:strand:+ start:6631 stop:7110 length:480 start_codon:yes stop_codon:yes gene_type:complete